MLADNFLWDESTDEKKNWNNSVQQLITHHQLLGIVSIWSFIVLTRNSIKSYIIHKSFPVST